MTLTQLLYFQTVCRSGSISRAAEILHISQPSISCAIKDLESEFNVTLFQRQYRGMSLTEEGRQFFELANHLLTYTRQTTQAMHDVSQQKRQLRIGVPPMIGSLFLPQLYPGFVEAYPDINITLEEAGRQELLQQLSQGQLDCALLPHDRPFDGSLSCVKIAQLETVCCVSPMHPLAERSAVQMEHLSDFPLVLFKDSFFQTESIMRRFSECGLSPHVTLYTSQLSTVSALVSKNTAIGFMFRQLSDPIPDIISIPLKPAMAVQVSLAWRRHSFFSRELKQFIDYMTELFPQET